MSPPEFDPQRVLRALVDGGVVFVVIGGVAAVLHGSARITQDIDVCFATDHENLTALGAVLTALGARPRGAPPDIVVPLDATLLRRVEILTLVTDAGDFDVLARPAGAPPFATLLERADRYDVDGMRVPVAAINDLLAMKRAAGRAKDLSDIAELEAIVRLRG